MPNAGKSEKPIELTITRLFNAPRDLIFRMWSEPEHMNRWFHPKDFAVPEATMDFRPGGAWSSRILRADGTSYRMAGSYLEIVTNERIVFTHAWIGDDGKPGHETVITVTFEDAGKGTSFTFHQAAFETEVKRDSHIEGWDEVLDSLTGYLSQQLQET